MLTSLLEGEEDIALLDKMNVSLQIPDLKNRMLNVFGNFLKDEGEEINLYPQLTEEEEEEATITTSTLSERHQYNFLGSISMNTIEMKLKDNSFEGCLAEAFELCILMEKLSPRATKNITTKASFTVDQYKVYEFLTSHMGRIEIARDG